MKEQDTAQLDLVERLRDDRFDCRDEAADEIVRLRFWLSYIDGNHRDARQCAKEALAGRPNPYEDNGT